jgi:23S rRNA (pseudouridine1915-N3)-methyltransferase
VKLTIVAVGNKMPDWVETAFTDYTKRMPPHMRVELKEIKAEKREGGKTAQQIMEAEKARIEAALPDGAMLIAMDERGAQISSLLLADWMREWQGEGRDVASDFASRPGASIVSRTTVSRLFDHAKPSLPSRMNIKK